MRNETPETQLSYQDLARAVYIQTIPYMRRSVEPDYLTQRIKLLIEAFQLDEEHYQRRFPDSPYFFFDDLVTGKLLPPVNLVGFDGFFEGPDAESVLGKALRDMTNRHSSRMKEAMDSIDEVRREWIDIFIAAHFTDEEKARTVPLSWLIERGLPATPPEWDPWENW